MKKLPLVKNNQCAKKPQGTPYKEHAGQTLSSN
jgi:hypothetical protein